MLRYMPFGMTQWKKPRRKNKSIFNLRPFYMEPLQVWNECPREKQCTRTNSCLENGLMYLYKGFHNVMNASTTYTKYKS